MEEIGHKTLETVLAPEDQWIAVKENPVSGNKRKRLRNAGVSAPAGKLRRSVRGLQGSLIWPSHEGHKHAAVWCPPHASNWSQGLMPTKRSATWATPQHVWYNSFSSVTSQTQEDTDKEKKYFLQRLAVGKDGFASSKAGTTEAEALEDDGKMMKKVPLEPENSWTAFMSQLEPSSPCLSGPLTSS